MAGLLRAGKRLGDEPWSRLRTRMIFDFCKWDPQSEDHSVLANFPLLLDADTARNLCVMAEALTAEALAAEKEILANKNLIDVLGLPRSIRRVLTEEFFLHDTDSNLRVMRFDFHCTQEGWRISEVNADVPGGFIEATGWNSLFAREEEGCFAPPRTSEIYANAIRDAAGPNGLVALVHATGYSDDRQVMQHLAQCLGQKGLRACLVSPAHVCWDSGHAEVHSSFYSGRVDAMVRFFPAEWLPNLGNDNLWRPHFQGSATPLSNPASAILLQTKRFPLLWEKLHVALPTWKRLLPETYSPRKIANLEDESWVLKPALGRVGEGIGMPGITPRNQLDQIRRFARRKPEDWVVQRRFQIASVMTDDGPVYPCIGVFTIGGRAAGFYGRAANQPLIDQEAQDVAVLISSGSKEVIH